MQFIRLGFVSFIGHDQHARPDATSANANTRADQYPGANSHAGTYQHPRTYARAGSDRHVEWRSGRDARR